MATAPDALLARDAKAALEERVFQSLMLAADHLLRAEVDVLRVAELTFPQYNVLRILRGARPDGLSCGAISQRMIARDSDLTRILDGLAQRDLVRRGRDPHDRRVITAEITDTGLQLLRRLDGAVGRVHRDRLAHMARTDLETLRVLANRVREQPR